MGAFQDRLPPNSIMAALERAFRTVDVDLYNEDNYKEEADEAISDSVDTDQVNSLLGANKNVDALKTFLSGSPDAAKDPAVKKNYLDLAGCPRRSHQRRIRCGGRRCRWWSGSCR